MKFLETNVLRRRFVPRNGQTIKNNNNIVGLTWENLPSLLWHPWPSLGCSTAGYLTPDCSHCACITFPSLRRYYKGAITILQRSKDLMQKIVSF